MTHSVDRQTGHRELENRRKTRIRKITFKGGRRQYSDNR